MKRAFLLSTAGLACTLVALAPPSFSQDTPDLEDRLQAHLAPQVPLVLNGESVGFVAYPLQQQQAPRARRELHRILSPREKEPLRLESPRTANSR